MQSTDAREPERTPARPARRVLVLASLRSLGTVAATITLYYVLPLEGKHDAAAAVLLGLGLVAFVLVALRQVRGILHSPYPGIRAIQALALLIPIFIIAFASFYYVTERHDPASFSSGLSRTDALYFTVTVLSTVGFGDIVARSETARVVVTVQMIGDLVILGALVRGVFTAATHARQQPQAALIRLPPSADADAAPESGPVEDLDRL